MRLYRERERVQLLDGRPSPFQRTDAPLSLEAAAQRVTGRRLPRAPRGASTHHVPPVQHLQDVAEQLAAGLQVLLSLQMVLELIRHHGEQDLSAVCRDTGVPVSGRPPQWQRVLAGSSSSERGAPFPRALPSPPAGDVRGSRSRRLQGTYALTRTRAHLCGRLRVSAPFSGTWRSPPPTISPTLGRGPNTVNGKLQK